MTHQLTPYLDLFDEAWLLTDEEGALEGWNRAATGATGYADGDLESMTLTDLVADGDVEHTSEAVADALKSESGRATVD
ncbi:MAG: PAS domain-containing protein, partial [Halobacteriales archaeon]|nr:PAS domain-containing protein [Halobacteriales archaeon]